MEMNESETRRSLVLGWLRQETFWQGVAASTISAGLLAAGSLLTALTTGLADWRMVVLGFLSFLVVFIAAWIALNLVPIGNTARASLIHFKKTMKSDESGVTMRTAVVMLLFSLAALIVLASMTVPTV